MSADDWEAVRLALRTAYTAIRKYRDDEMVDDILRRLDGMCIDITMTIEADQFCLPLDVL